MKIVRPCNRIDQQHLSNLKKYDTKHKRLHEICKPLLTVAQWFGILPVIGIRKTTPIDLKFSFYSWRFFYSIIILCATIVLGSTNFMQLIADGVNFYRSIGALFYLFSMLIFLMFMKLAYFWPKFMQEWATVEYELSAYPPSFNLQRKLYTISIGLLVFATLEHLLSVSSTIVSIGTCTSKGGDLQAYFEIRFIQVFNRTQFTYWKGFLFQLINILCTFAWSFIDLFLIMISLALTELFQRITTTHESVWRNLREDFNKITSLCRLSNDIISDIVLLSYTNNLCFICAQILHSITPMKHITDGIYFFYSMTFLISRTLFLTLMVSKVHQSSRSPLPLLFQVPGYSYCLEIGRFIQQIASEVIAITGMNFFYVRKEMVLSVAGTIITYELVLIQFNAQAGSNDFPPPKNITDMILLPPCSIYDADDTYELYLNQSTLSGQ